MIYAAEDRKSEKNYTFLPKFFDVIDNAQLQYNWLITACEFNVANPIEDEYFAKGYCWITGEELTVAVTMGGVDITSSVYSDGVITIARVTGDLEIGRAHV